ncbi:helix-turn-helix transcriptional regulator [Jiulongibacter sediminis]|uniref:HTH luxR-type domain-containing protein n=1 Tax=Jiulongibacter sediminis TaxID=1605367 RepID=A0A0P7BEK9_9BACT|nr:LuxR C-terminal-related transcriptional regulator [Jiulongibacter sediminis]KPM49207.1 hypothetical protein AFM12_00765 [Jiulongibacter sediminis]TBX26262.1 hypothetical protein TK44_00765 [Jiulongibacter sediminis]
MQQRINNYSSSLSTILTDLTADSRSPRNKELSKKFFRFPEEAIFIYSFIEDRIVYADGWPEVLGYGNEEMNMHLYIAITTEEFASFTNELNQQALQYIAIQSEDLELHGYSMQLKKYHKDGREVPLVANVNVFKTLDGKITEIICRSMINRNLKFGKVMQYSTYGPKKDNFEDKLNKDLFSNLTISLKEKETVGLLAQGKSYKQIAAEQNVTISAIEKRIAPLFKRFDVNGVAHLISFCHENYLID